MHRHLLMRRHASASAYASCECGRRNASARAYPFGAALAPRDAMMPPMGGVLRRRPHMACVAISGARVLDIETGANCDLLK